jgi:hypothetical protein
MKYYNEFQRRPKFVLIWMLIMGSAISIVAWLIKTLGLV